MNGKIIIIGSRGFIGSHLMFEIRKKWPGRVIGLDSGRLDLLKPASTGILSRCLDKRTTLITLATARRGLDGDRLIRHEILMAEHLAVALRKKKIRKWVHFSTTSVYGDAGSNPSITEETPIFPNTSYGIGKFAGECLVRAAVEQNGTKWLCVRPTMVYGPGDHGGSYGPGRLINSTRNSGRVILFGDGTERRDFIYVGDLARIVVALLLQDRNGVYNVGSGRGHSMRDVVNLLAGLTCSRIKIQCKARLRRKVDLKYNIGKLQSALPGFRFTPLRAGIEQSVQHSCPLS